MSDININEKIEVLYKDQVYKSQIQEIIAKQIFISLPTKGTSQISITNGESFEVLYYKGKNVFKFNGIVIDKTTENTVPQLIISYPVEIKKIQRREFFRVEVVYYVEYLKVGEELNSYEIINNLDPEKGNKGILLDISGGGLKLKLKDKLNIGDVIVTKIPMENEKVVVMGRVVRCELDDSKRYVCGVEFENMDSKTQEKIIRFIFDRIRRQIKAI